MHSKFLPAGVSLLALCASVQLIAQALPTNQTVATAPTDPSLDPLLNALQKRKDLAASIGSGAATSDAALVQLKTLTLPAGLQGDPDADFANAAIDVGQQLMVAGKPADARKFFLAAEASLTLLIGRTADTAVQAKVQYLSIRAYIRAQFLSEEPLAKADLGAALKLTPGDPSLISLQNLLASQKAQQFQNTPQG